MRCIAACCAAFPGHSMPRADPVLIFDLDGTVLRLNSFPVWVLFVAFGGATHLTLAQRWAIGWRALRLVLERKRRRMDHEEMLRRMQALWAQCADPQGRAASRLQSLLMRQVRRNLRTVLRQCENGMWDGVLATAAAADYAEGLGHRLGFRDVLATPSGREPDETSNSGERKHSRLMAWLHARGWQERPLMFFNDDLVDLPLMREARVVFWYGSRRSMEAARRMTTARIVACRGLSEPELRATVARQFQSVMAERLEDQLRASTAA